MEDPGYDWIKIIHSFNESACCQVIFLRPAAVACFITENETCNFERGIAFVHSFNKNNMEIVGLVFGRHGENLSVLQMVSRAILVFFISLILLRLSGRRSFGMRLPLDNIIVILLGAVLSRAVVGASPFLPTVAAATAIVALHRMVGYVQVKNKELSHWLQGHRILLFENGIFLKRNLVRALVSEEDIYEVMRLQAFDENLETIDKVYMERNGRISIIKKKPAA